MILRILTASLIPAVAAWAAITEKYVTSSASGSGDGTSGNPYTLSQMVTEINAGSGAGVRYNVQKDAAYSRGASDVISGSGTASAPVIIRGYSSSIGDGFLGRANDSGDLVTTNMPAITYTGTTRLSITGTWVLLETLNVTGGPSLPVVAVGNDSAISRCRIENTSTNPAAVGISLNSRCIAWNTDVVMSGALGGSEAITATNASGRVYGCRVKVTSSSCRGIVVQSSTVVARNTIFGSGGIGIAMTSTSGAPALLDNTIVGCSADGIDIITGATALQFLVGNQITDNAGNGIDMVSTANAAFIAANRFRDNAASINSGSDWVTATLYGNVDSGTTGDTSTDYVNYAGNDFRLLSTSPSTSAGVPAKASIGALQRDQTAAPSGGSEKSHVFVQ